MTYFLSQGAADGVFRWDLESILHLVLSENISACNYFLFERVMTHQSLHLSFNHVQKVMNGLLRPELPEGMGRAGIVKHLLDRGAHLGAYCDSEGRMLQNASFLSGENHEILRLLVDHGVGMTHEWTEFPYLQVAARKRNIDMIKLLASKRQEIQRLGVNDHPLLRRAIQQDQREIVASLVLKGATIRKGWPR